ncbi:MAG: hypothetical protein ACLGJC_30250 [Alphaproteobacteria bacterium]
MSAGLDPNGFGTGCCLLRIGAVEGSADNTLESWLGAREKAPAPMPPSDAAPTRTTVIQKGGETETDWRLIPFIAAQASGGIPGQPTLLSIAVTSPYGQPNPQHEAITYVLIDNLPPGTTLSNGDRIADDTWRVRLEELPGLTMTLPPGTADSVTLHLTAVTDHGGGVIAKQARDLTIAILPAATETAAPEPGGTQPPAQGGSSQSIETAALADRPEPDPAASGQSAPQAAGEPTEGEARAPAPDPAPDPVPAPVAEAAPAPPPEQTADAAIEPTSAPSPELPAEAPVVSATPPPVETSAVVQPAVASPSSPPAPPEPAAIASVTTVTVAALPPAAAPPPAPEQAQPREAAVQRPARLPSAIAETTLMKRGDDLFAQGDLAGARLYYEMVAETGNAAAALALGRTHDPLIHERLRVRGLPSDPEQAAVWYRRAVAAGSGDAEQQLQKLTVWLAGKSR